MGPISTFVTLMESSFPSMLITGLPGVPGWNLFHWFRKHWKGEVIGIRPVKNLKAHAEGAVELDAEDHQGLIALFAKHRFGVVVDASGNCALRACECDAQLSYLLNCDFGVRLARLAKEYGAQLVRLSSDLVFSGDDSHGGMYREEEATDPVTVYGKDMAAAEEQILAVHPSAKILRIPLPMGYTPGGHAGAIDWIEWRFRNDRPATLYFDEVRNPIFRDDLSKVVAWMLEQPDLSSGIYHCGGLRTVSLYEIGQIINAVGGYGHHLLMGCLRQEAGPMPPRAGNVTMDSSKLHSMLPAGLVRSWPLEPGLWPTHRMWHAEVDRGLWGGGHRVESLLVAGDYIHELETL